MQSCTDSAEWHIANRQRLAAIKLQRGKVEELEQRGKIQELKHQAQQRELDSAARRLEVQKAERLAAVELQKEKKLAAQREKKLDAQREKSLAAIEIQRKKFEERDLREKIRDRDRQCKNNDNAARRLELRRVKEQLEAVRGEKLRLDSLATVEQDRELWRLQDEARALKHREQERLREEAGLRAGGAYKRPVAHQQATKPPAKRRLVDVENKHSR